jgi:phosphatidyl-myo-inositol alpha-mannosyltransferase
VTGLRIGIVCPYSLDVPGGVQSHVLDLARALIALGHTVSVLAPADDERPAGAPVLPDFVTPAGRAVSVPYNGSVARITFGPVSYARVRRWLAEHTFDVLHLHEPGTFSLSSLALFEAEGPIVATFHTSTERSRATLVFARPINALMEKVTARIAVSPMARRVQVEHLGGDAVEIPNGVDVPLFASGPLLPGYPRAGHTVGFLGRFGEPRKGMAVLLEALRLLVPQRPDLRLLVVGRGDPEALRREAGPELAERLDILGGVDDVTKAAALRSMDVYCAPNTGGESFGIVLVEAMAARTAVVASELDAFRRVLMDGTAGRLVPIDDPEALAAGLIEVLESDAVRARYIETAATAVRRYDWSVVAGQILRVYETVAGAGAKVEVAGTAGNTAGAFRAKARGSK